MAEGSRLEPSPLIPNETGRVKLMVVDEAWRYLRDPPVLAYLAEGRPRDRHSGPQGKPAPPASGWSPLRTDSARPIDCSRCLRDEKSSWRVREGDHRVSFPVK